MADLYAQIRPGTDIAYLIGIIRYALAKNAIPRGVRQDYTNAPVHHQREVRVQRRAVQRLRRGEGELRQAVLGLPGRPEDRGYSVDPTLQNPRCVFQLLKKHVDRYTPEVVERITGTPKETFLKVAEVVTSTFTPDRAGTVTYALGWTQHSVGVQMIRAAAMLQLLLGNVGRPGGGVNALRGHSNIQGCTDLGGTFEILSGYLATPRSELVDSKTYLEKVPPTTLNAQPWATMNYWSNYPRFMVSLLKAFFGRAATKENDFGYSWLPKTDGNHSWLYLFDDMYRGKSTRAGGEEPGPEG